MPASRCRLRPGIIVIVLISTMLAVAVVPADASARVPSADEARTEARLFDQHDVARANPGTFGYGSMSPQGALNWAEDVAEVARARSDEMARTGVCQHNPHLSSETCCWSFIGENIGYAPDGSAPFGSAGDPGGADGGSKGEDGNTDGASTGKALVDEPKDPSKEPVKDPVKTPDARSIDRACPKDRVATSGSPTGPTGHGGPLSVGRWPGSSPPVSNTGSASRCPPPPPTGLRRRWLDPGVVDQPGGRRGMGHRLR